MNQNNAIFIYRDVINLGPINPLATGSIATIDNTNYSDNPGYIDWSTVKLKRGDNIFYNKQDRDALTGALKKTSTPVSIGVLNTEPGATRLTFAANVGDDVYRDFLKGGVTVYAIRRKNTSGRCIYSYPIRNYVGACDFSNSIISLFFERTSGLIDEIRLNVTKGSAYHAIKRINSTFRDGTSASIVFDENEDTMEGSFTKGVNKVITTIPSNRN